MAGVLAWAAVPVAAAGSVGDAGAAVGGGEADAAQALRALGRPATAAEVKAWDIDVRPDFTGLPAGSGSVADGEIIWDERCASCHGVFGESNEVFTPLVGGTTKADMERGRVRNLEASAGFAQRTTLMKAWSVATLWDYINRAMPWDKPKSLQTDEVYAVLAYMLNLGDIVPADFTLDEKTIIAVQAKMPNRNGMHFFEDLWRTDGKGDVQNVACMRDCPVGDLKPVLLPEHARDTHGNLAEQVRAFGAVRGIPGAGAASAAAVPAVATAAGSAAGSVAPVAPGGSAAAAAPALADAQPLLQANGCLACHGLDRKLVGPALKDVAARYAGRADKVGYLAERISQGGQGVWGPIPMPPQPQLSADDVHRLASWIAAGLP